MSVELPPEEDRSHLIGTEGALTAANLTHSVRVQQDPRDPFFAAFGDVHVDSQDVVPI